MSDEIINVQIPNNWSPRLYQAPLWKFLHSGGKRAVVIWHRRCGKDTTAINWCIESMIDRPGLYWHLFPTYNQGRKIAWDGFYDTSRPFLDAFPEAIIHSKNNNDMRIQLKGDFGGGIFQIVGSDDPNRLVGSNPFGVIFSEYALCNPEVWKLISPILRKNGGWAVFIFTPRGRNHAWKMYEMAQKNPSWFAQLLTVDDTFYVDEVTGLYRRVFTQEDIEKERAEGMPEAIIQQEYYCSPDAPMEGAFYVDDIIRAQKEKRICNVPYDPNYLVHTAWDVGGDCTAVWFYQFLNNTIRFIDYYECAGKPMSYHLGQVKPLYHQWGKHIAPHDMLQRKGWYGDTMKKEAARAGFNFHVLPKSDLYDGINMVHKMFPRSWFDKTKCAIGLQRLGAYQKKKAVTTTGEFFLDEPLHNEASHGSDSLRYAAMGEKVSRSMENYGHRKHEVVTECDLLGWRK